MKEVPKKISDINFIIIICLYKVYNLDRNEVKRKLLKFLITKEIKFI